MSNREGEESMGQAHGKSEATKSVAIDVRKLDEVMRSELQRIAPDAEKKAEAVAQASGIRGFAALDKAEELSDSFCAAWPKVQPFINVALKGVGFFQPSIAAKARACINAINQVLYPALCQGDRTGGIGTGGAGLR